jgi:S-adenosylhomocysteine hydrolase
VVEVARLKLAALGVEIDTPTPEQAQYRGSWGTPDDPPGV